MPPIAHRSFAGSSMPNSVFLDIVQFVRAGLRSVVDKLDGLVAIDGHNGAFDAPEPRSNAQIGGRDALGNEPGLKRGVREMFGDVGRGTTKDGKKRSGRV